MQTEIHPTAIISDGAKIGAGTKVGAYSIIGPNVTIGRDNFVGPHAVIEGNTTIGDRNKIYQFASVGSDPQDLKYRGEKNALEIGDGNLIREYVTIQPGTESGGLLTRIGNDNLFMVMSHVGHDAIIGSGNVIANSAALAGHVNIGSGVIVGALVGIHQFVRVGDGAMISGGSMVVKDIPPFCTAQGDRCGLVGINKIGLQRKGVVSEDISKLRRVYRAIFSSAGRINDRVSEARLAYPNFNLAKTFLDFFEKSERGVTTPRKDMRENPDDE